MCPAISICLVDGEQFPEVEDYHLKFELYDVEHRTRFSDLIQVHVLQIPKLDRGPDELRDELEAWLYLFQHPEAIDPEHLPAKMDQPIYREAIKELEMLTKDEIERERYESRQKAILDQRSFANELKRMAEKAEQAERARQQAERARQQAEQALDKGEYIGRIGLCEQLLNRPLTPHEGLLQLSMEQLKQRADDLQAELRNR